MKRKGISKSRVIEISKIKNEPEWMTEFRVNSYKCFEELWNPSFGPELKINFDDITYYKKVGDSQNDWNKVPKEVKDTFNKLGIIEAEQKYLAGIGAQVESVVIYHNMLKELVDKNVIFCDTDTALREYPEIFEKYFNKLVKYNENKYTE